MHWLIKVGDKQIPARLPDVLVDGQPFALQLHEGAAARRFTAVWYRATDTLALIDEKGVEKLVRLRSRSFERGEDGPQHRVQAELLARGPEGVRYPSMTAELHMPGIERKGGAKAQNGLVVRSQITGKVLKVLVKTGDAVAAGDTLVIVEAMKMENKVFAAAAGVVAAVAVKDGDPIATGKELLRLGPQS
jgi:biotin carboxyl carrier protein